MDAGVEVSGQLIIIGCDPASFDVPHSELTIWNAEGKWGNEPGTFTVWTGGSSRADLTTNFILKP
jgi:hypothetical protein